MKINNILPLLIMAFYGCSSLSPLSSTHTKSQVAFKEAPKEAKESQELINQGTNSFQEEKKEKYKDSAIIKRISVVPFIYQKESINEEWTAVALTQSLCEDLKAVSITADCPTSSESGLADVNTREYMDRVNSHVLLGGRIKPSERLSEITVEVFVWDNINKKIIYKNSKLTPKKNILLASKYLNIKMIQFMGVEFDELKEVELTQLPSQSPEAVKHYWQARSAKEKGAFEESTKHLRQALNHDPYYPEAHQEQKSVVRFNADLFLQKASSEEDKVKWQIKSIKDILLWGEKNPWYAMIIDHIDPSSQETTDGYVWLTVHLKTKPNYQNYKHSIEEFKRVTRHGDKGFAIRSLMSNQSEYIYLYKDSIRVLNKGDYHSLYGINTRTDEFNWSIRLNSKAVVSFSTNNKVFSSGSFDHVERVLLKGHNASVRRIEVCHVYRCRYSGSSVSIMMRKEEVKGIKEISISKI